jgi:hypothetical protein
LCEKKNWQFHFVKGEEILLPSTPFQKSLWSSQYHFNAFENCFYVKKKIHLKYIIYVHITIELFIAH